MITKEMCVLIYMYTIVSAALWAALSFGLSTAFKVIAIGVASLLLITVACILVIFIYGKTNKYDRTRRSTNTEKLAKKAATENMHILAAIAVNPNTDSETLQKLSKHTDMYVLRYVIGNLNTTRETLRQLAERDLDWEAKNALEEARKKRIENLLPTLNENDQKIATLVAPTFTGWEDDLMQTIQTLKHADTVT